MITAECRPLHLGAIPPSTIPPFPTVVYDDAPLAYAAPVYAYGCPETGAADIAAYGACERYGKQLKKATALMRRGQVSPARETLLFLAVRR
jgi:hypothetical protein